MSGPNPCNEMFLTAPCVFLSHDECCFRNGQDLFLHRTLFEVGFTTRPLYPRGKSPRYPMDKRLDGPQSRSGHWGHCREPNPVCLAGIPSLYQLSYPS
jgi:hypothetical protein